MVWIIAIIVGAIVGWLASISYKGTRRQNTLLNILIGAIGGLFGVWLFFGVFGIITASAAANFWLGILWSLIGAVVFMAIAEAVYMSRRESMYGEERREERAERAFPYDYEEEERIRRKRRK